MQSWEPLPEDDSMRDPFRTMQSARLCYYGFCFFMAGVADFVVLATKTVMLRIA